MIDRTRKLTPHFTLGEFVPEGVDDVPAEVLANLIGVALVLEAVRRHFGLPVVVHHNGGWRPGEVNEAAGGVKGSDHKDGRAADFHVAAGNNLTWEQNTIAAFRFLRDEMKGKFGQVILEDHREHYGEAGKLWCHVSTPTRRHPGTGGDSAAVLLSTAPGHYVSASVTA